MNYYYSFHNIKYSKQGFVSTKRILYKRRNDKKPAYIKAASNKKYIDPNFYNGFGYYNSKGAIPWEWWYYAKNREYSVDERSYWWHHNYKTFLDPSDEHDKETLKSGFSRSKIEYSFFTKFNKLYLKWKDSKNTGRKVPTVFKSTEKFFYLESISLENIWGYMNGEEIPFKLIGTKKTKKSKYRGTKMYWYRYII